ncbi:MAG: GAF domain-containing protein [Candidatus Pacebacteria bacterium]|nr:GAF domain-containing protein [Candidatus Paceibacterota bacterium]
MLTVAIIAGILASLLNLISRAKYIYSTLYGDTRPSRLTWFINSINWGIQFWSAFFVADHFSPVFYTLLLSFPAAIAIFLISLNPKYGVGGYEKTDLVCLALLPVVIFAWQWSGNSVLGIVGAMGIEYIAMLPTFLKIRQRPFAEDMTAWSLSLFTSFVNLLTVSQFNLTLIFYVVANFMRQCSLLGFLYMNQRNHPFMIERILLRARELTGADGGTLYEMTEDRQRLEFSMVHSGTLNLSLGGTTGKRIEFPPLEIYDLNGKANFKNVATSVAATGETLNIKDVYYEERFDFSGTRAFDQKTGYRSQSMLTIPLLDLDNNVVGVVQLINAQKTADDGTVTVVPFTREQEEMVKIMGHQAAEALTLQQRMKAQGNPIKAFILLVKLGMGFGRRRVGAVKVPLRAKWVKVS